jgi:nucleotide-binding universal stress UspA family protein
MAKKKSPPLLVADEITLDSDRDRRASAVKACANRLAQKLQCSVDLVHVEDLLLYPIQNPDYKPLVERHFKERKSKLAELAQSFQVPARPLFLNGEPAKKILALAAKRNAYEMIALGTHGRKGLSRLILGSVAEEVIRQARVPVLTVGPKAQEKGAELLAQPKLKILVPTGLTANSARAEDYALALARRLGAELVFVHSLHDALHPVLQTAFSAPSPSPQIRGYFEEIKKDATQALARKVKKAQQKGVVASSELDDKTLSSSDSVLRAAERAAASLIVMGTHGRSLVGAAFFGRTARDVILGASAPVITVRSGKA